MTGVTPGTGWTTANGQFSGAYNQNVEVGPFNISGGAVTLVIRDSNHPTCQTTITAQPTEPCSQNLCDLSN